MTSPVPRAQPRRSLTVEEYLRLEETSLVKHEYVYGAVYAMSGTRVRHNRIVSNVHVRLWNAARGGSCVALREDVKLQVSDDVVYYPDVMLVYTPHDEDAAVVTDACLVVEVTSGATAATDRREKLVNYKKVPALRAYLVVDHRRQRVERHWRDDAGEWWQATVTGEEPIPLPCVDLSLTLAEIYEGVQVPAVSEPESPADDAAAAREEAREEELADEELEELEEREERERLGI
jgi:Uma2 family endonuclease